jgi:hypothetical protein
VALNLHYLPTLWRAHSAHQVPCTNHQPTTYTTVGSRLRSEQPTKAKETKDERYSYLKVEENYIIANVKQRTRKNPHRSTSEGERKLSMHKNTANTVHGRPAANKPTTNKQRKLTNFMMPAHVTHPLREDTSAALGLRVLRAVERGSKKCVRIPLSRSRLNVDAKCDCDGTSNDIQNKDATYQLSIEPNMPEDLCPRRSCIERASRASFFSLLYRSCFAEKS